ncbi:hypothetical protein [Pseudoalteromonas umbrosa]|nr:hypothetical protein [Pseudoalteromonas sp. B95]MDK1288604.1 hypothetical protein [Pseudoalteromonas sp. B95]
MRTLLNPKDCEKICGRGPYRPAKPKAQSAVKSIDDFKGKKP